MKKLVLLLLLLSVLKLSAQNYDLIVIVKGDSIACQIDSITDSNIYFEMMINDRWVHTNTSKIDCINYELNTIDKKVVIFKSGSTYIDRISTSKLKAYYYDLIITTQGDSIACNIDSITDSHIYFEMMVKSNWFHTHTTINKVTEYKYDAINKKQVIFKQETSYIDKIAEPLDFTDKRIYASRYLFAPSAFGANKGVNSYTTYDILLQDIQFGISNSFSLGLGTTLFAIPFYVMPTYYHQINEKSAFAVGDLLMFSPYSDLTFFGNLFYGMYTRGNMDNNFSFGIGLWTTTESDIASETISPAINLSASIRVNDKIQFLTENYYLQMNTETDFHYRPDEIVEEFKDETFSQYINVIGGISGLRFYTQNPRNSWQLGLVYYFTIWDFPNKYDEPGWYNFKNEIGFIALPIISYSRKF